MISEKQNSFTVNNNKQYNALNALLLLMLNNYNNLTKQLKWINSNGLDKAKNNMELINTKFSKKITNF